MVPHRSFKLKAIIKQTFGGNSMAAEKAHWQESLLGCGGLGVGVTRRASQQSLAELPQG